MAALSKYWRPLTVNEYLHEMDVRQVEEACRYAGFPKEVIDDIWEKKKQEPKGGIVWTS